MLNSPKTIAVIGAGPVGLAAASHVLQRGMRPIVLEEGAEVGHAVRQRSHVRMFSPWSYNVDKAAEAFLREAGWNSPEPERYPTGGELVAQYLEPLANRTKLSQYIQTNARVIAVGRLGFDKVKTVGRESAPFEARYQNGKGPATSSAIRTSRRKDKSGRKPVATISSSAAMWRPQQADVRLHWRR
jgi:glycine/D-amino acid oxidase-like deaminating enzyme